MSEAINSAVQMQNVVCCYQITLDLPTKSVKGIVILTSSKITCFSCGDAMVVVNPLTGPYTIGTSAQSLRVWKSDCESLGTIFSE
jgi:hypothetical protein